MSWDRQVDDDRVLRQNFGQQIKKIVENEFRDKLKIEKEAEEMRPNVIKHLKKKQVSDVKAYVALLAV